MREFVKYPKTPRLVVDDDLGLILAGSRNKYVTPDNDEKAKGETDEE